MYFTINGVKWQIRLVTPNSNYLKRSDGTITLGVTDNELKTVFINRNLSDFMFQKVLTHEITHVFCFEMGCLLDIETEEIIADFLATFGREVLQVADDILCRFKMII